MTNALAAMNRRAVATGKVLETLEKTAADGRDLTQAVRETSENFKIALNTLIESSNKSPTQESMIEQSAKIIEKLDQNQNILQTALGRLELLENQAEITVLTEIKSICDAIQKLDLSITSALLEYGKNGNRSLLEISEQFKVSMGAQTQAILDLKQSLRTYSEQIK
jgi:DNA integrity scanning protein DisA with diadenylate cyclase activity